MAPKIQLEESIRGGLRIWDMPRQGRKYVIGADTGGGNRKGDFGAATVIDGETCNLVARWAERSTPHVWGPNVGMLGHLYNDALVAFETLPSAHGMTAAMECVAFGYRNLYRRQRTDTLTRNTTDVLGWHTHSQTKPLIIDRVKRALSEGAEIPDEMLLLQMHSRFRNERGEMDGAGHDDLIIAYGITLIVRDQSWVAGKLRPVIEEPTTPHDRYWEAQKKLWSKPVPKIKPAWLQSPPWKK